MGETLTLVQSLVARRDIRVSAHGFQKLAKERILLEEIATGVNEAVVIEDYPSAFKGPTVLVLQWVADKRPVHVLWGLERDQPSPAVLVTAYRPDASRWSADFLSRRQS